jgi:hypothetical protein
MMNEALVIGYLVLAVITLGAFVAVIMKFVQPINELRIVVQKLLDRLESTEKNDAVRDERIKKHGEELTKLTGRVGKLETKMDMYHKE